MEFFKVRNLCYLLFVANFFMGSCSTSSVQSSKDLPSKKVNALVKEEEHVWMEKFFKEFFLEGASIYTLFGSKPLSGQPIIYASAEERQKSAIALLKREGIEGEEKEKMLSEMSKEYLEYDFHENWEKWISFVSDYPNSPFIFAKRPTLSKNLWTGYILNVQEMVWTLQRHYDIFKKQLGSEFDPVVVTLEFADINSSFWKQVFSSHLLSGIVYGYGYKNSYFFNMYIQTPNGSLGEHGLFSSLVKKRENDNSHHSVANIILPRFRSFGLPFNFDPVLEKYRLERKKIKSELNDSNFFEMALSQLIGELAKEETSQN